MGYSLLKDKLRLLMGVDIFLVFVAIFSSYLLRFGPNEAIRELQTKPLVNLLAVVLVVTFSSLILDIYDFNQHNLKIQIFTNAILTACLSFIALSMTFYLFPELKLGRGVLLSVLIIFAALQFSWHVLFCNIFSNPLVAKKVLVVGTDAVAQKIGGILDAADFSLTHRLVGYLAHDGELLNELVEKGESCFRVDNSDDLFDIVQQNKISQIVVTTRDGIEDSIVMQGLLQCKLKGIDIFDAQTFYESMTGKLMLENTGSNWLLFSTGFKSTLAIVVAKRVVDILVSSCGLVLSLPLIPLVALIVKLNAPGPLLYSQDRVGQGGKVFRLYKFRTMPVNAEDGCGAVWAQPNDQRIGPLGRVMRKWRIDEIPQLYNILIGDMSLVGPRPERPEFVEKLNRLIPHYAKRHFIKPGLTGWAQVRYPYGSSVEDSYEKLRFDLYYFKNMSPILDTIVFLKTFKVVLFGFGGR